MFPGLPERLEKEIIRLAPRGTKVNVVASPARIDGAWIGGSIVGSLPQFADMAISRAEYLEVGTGIVHRKNRP
jgi:actin-related protein